MVHSGYLPFGTFQSDHRALWIDLTQSSVYGFKIPTTIHPNIRRSQCNVPHVRNKWIQLYTQCLRQNKVIQRQFKLEAGISDGSIDENQVKEFEKILQLRTEGFNFIYTLHIFCAVDFWALFFLYNIFSHLNVMILQNT